MYYLLNILPKSKIMLQLNVKNETSKLRAVVLGSAKNNGPTPTIEEAYDPKSLEHLIVSKSFGPFFIPYNRNLPSFVL